MGTVLVCGLCPLPFENVRKSFGPGIRTWQFAQPLAAAGHDVHVIAMRIPGAYDGDQPADGEHEGVHVKRVEQATLYDLDWLRARVDEIAPDVVVGATVYGSNPLARLEPEVPFWADQFGHFLAEAQAKAHLEGANWPLAHFYDLLRPVLRRADRLSVVSEPQRWAAVGELGMAGRLTHETCGYEFVDVIPCALVPPQQSSSTDPSTGASPRRMLRGTDAMPDDAFVAFWSGGYNVWSDVDTLFRALETAMDRCDRLHFVSTGGEIGGHDETTYRRFEESIAGSRHRNRFHLQGWVPAEDVPAYTAEADLGVLCEIPMYEGMLGSKNRVVQWMGHGLPVLYNRVGDLGDLLATRDLGLVFEVGDAEAMADLLVWTAEHSEPVAEMAARARRATREELSFVATTERLRAWVAEPSPAPDHAVRASVVDPSSFAPSPMPLKPPSEESLQVDAATVAAARKDADDATESTLTESTDPTESTAPASPEPVAGALRPPPRPRGLRRLIQMLRV